MLPNLESLFDDCTKPLVLDLGCGYGTFLLGLCKSLLEGKVSQNQIIEESPNKKSRREELSTNSNLLHTSYLNIKSHLISQGCNFLGCDMSHRAITYANSLSVRWNIQKSCNFLCHKTVEKLQF